MAQRITEQNLKDIITVHSSIDDLQPFIDPAIALTDFVQTKDTDGLLTEALLKQIETYLSAHFYAIRDQQYRSKNTGGAGATFMGSEEMGLDYTPWGQMAKMMDVTGVLASLDEQKDKGHFGFFWTGKKEHEEVDWHERNR